MMRGSRLIRNIQRLSLSYLLPQAQMIRHWLLKAITSEISIWPVPDLYDEQSMLENISGFYCRFSNFTQLKKTNAHMKWIHWIASMTQINATTVKCHLVKQSLLKTHRHRKQVKFLRTPINHFARSRHHGKQIKCPRAPIKNFSRYLTVIIIMPLCRVRLHCIHLRFFFLPGHHFFGAFGTIHNTTGYMCICNECRENPICKYEDQAKKLAF